MSVYVETADSVKDVDSLADSLRAASELMARIERTDQPLAVSTAMGEYAVPPCPAWCTLPADHDLDDESCRDFRGMVTRQHVCQQWASSDTVDEVRMYVQQLEEVGPGARPQDPPSVFLSCQGAELPGDAARMLAGELERAAARLDDIAGTAQRERYAAELTAREEEATE